MESAYVQYFPDDTPIEASAYFPDDEAAERQKSLADADLTALFEECRTVRDAAREIPSATAPDRPIKTNNQAQEKPSKENEPGDSLRDENDQQ